MIIGNVIGHIDQRIDGTQTDGLQAITDPFRARAVFYTLHHPPGENGTRMLRLCVKLKLNTDRAFEALRQSRQRLRFQRAQTGGGKIARDAIDTQTIWSVGRDGNLNDRIILAERIRCRGAHREIAFELDNAIVLVGKLKLPLGTHHAVGFNAANLRGLQHHAIRWNGCAGRCKNTRKPRLCIGCTTHNLQHLNLAFDKCFDLAEAKFVGIRMWHGFQNAGHSEGCQCSRWIDHLFHFEANHGQRLDNCFKGCVCFEMIFQPREGELHDESPPASVGTSSAENP